MTAKIEADGRARKDAILPFAAPVAVLAFSSAVFDRNKVVTHRTSTRYPQGKQRTCVRIVPKSVSARPIVGPKVSGAIVFRRARERFRACHVFLAHGSRDSCEVYHGRRHGDDKQLGIDGAARRRVGRDRTGWRRVLRRLFSHATALRGHPDFLNRSCPERSEGAAAQCRAERFDGALLLCRRQGRSVSVSRSRRISRRFGDSAHGTYTP
jgi:hypothetical protein